MDPIYTILVGIIAGIVLNMLPQISWEIATLIEIILCMAIYFYPAFMKKRIYSEQEITFFKLVKTPIREEDKPTISPQYVRALVYLFVFSMIVSGAMFSGMSIPSIDTTGGLYGFIAGIFCLLCGAAIYVFYRIRTNKTKK